MFLNARDRSPGDHRIPVWLVLLVVLLLFAVVGVGEYVVRVGRERAEMSPRTLAIKAAEAAVSEDPDDLDARLALAYAFQDAGRNEDALAEYDTVIAADATSIAARFNRGIVLLALERFDDAEQALSAVLEDAPTHVMAAKALAERYVATGRHAEALGVLAPAIAAQPRYSDVQYLAGVAAEELGRTDDAIEYYRGALKYEPDMAEARDGLMRLGATEGE